MEVRDGWLYDYLDIENFEDGATGTHPVLISTRGLLQLTPSVTDLDQCEQLTPSVTDLDQCEGDVQSSGKCQTHIYDCIVFRKSLLYDRLFKTSPIVLR